MWRPASNSSPYEDRCHCRRDAANLESIGCHVVEAWCRADGGGEPSFLHAANRGLADIQGRPLDSRSAERKPRRCSMCSLAPVNFALQFRRFDSRERIGESRYESDLGASDATARTLQLMASRPTGGWEGSPRTQTAHSARRTPPVIRTSLSVSDRRVIASAFSSGVRRLNRGIRYRRVAREGNSAWCAAARIRSGRAIATTGPRKTWQLRKELRESMPPEDRMSVQQKIPVTVIDLMVMALSGKGFRPSKASTMADSETARSAA